MRPLGQGGMGSVWLADHLALRTPCAMKFMNKEAAALPDIRARFEREAVAAARLRSPNVVQILDHGVWDGTPYIAMEVLEGEDLGQRLARLGPLPPREVLRIVTEVARALTKAHAVGLVHRDLKPANIFLVRDDDREVVKVLDFGVAKIKTGNETDAHTKTGALLGTPFYMSPEQATGQKSLDHRADLWSVGVIAYRCLTGALPFDDEALGALFMHIIADPLPVPSKVAAVPPGFDAWWLKAACRDAAGRFQSARELADALGPALGISIDRESALPPLPGGDHPSQPTDAAAHLLASPAEAAVQAVTPAVRTVAVPDGAVQKAIAAGGQVNATSFGAGSSLATSSSDRSPPAKLRFSLIAGVSLAGVLALVGLWMFRSRAHVDPSPAASVDPTPSAHPDPSPSESVAPPPAPSNSVVAPAPTVEPQVITTSSASVTPKPRPAPSLPIVPTNHKTATPPAPKPNCDPPYTRDAEGIKHAKPDCP